MDLLILLIKDWLDDPTTSFEDMIGLENLNGFGWGGHPRNHRFEISSWGLKSCRGLHPRLGHVCMILILYCSWCTCYLFNFAWTLTFMPLLALSNRQWTLECMFIAFHVNEIEVCILWHRFDVVNHYFLDLHFFYLACKNSVKCSFTLLLHLHCTLFTRPKLIYMVLHLHTSPQPFTLAHLDFYYLHLHGV
jgi:hypothetical protein